jgi:tetratricopeptide (TPR) repeat protein
VRLFETDADSDLAACRQALDLDPGRVDLVRRCAELLHEAGRDVDAVSLLRGEIERRRPDARIHATLGSILLEMDRAEEALEAFRRASGLPGAETLPETIERGIRRAGEAIHEAREPSPQRRAGRLVEEARRRMEVLDFRGAWKLVQKAESLAPSDASVLFTAGELHDRLGLAPQAEALFERAAPAGHPRAGERLALLRLAREVEEGRVVAGAGVHARLAALWAREGLPGRALAVLERAAVRFPDAPEILAPLADLYIFYGFPEKSESLYRRLLDVDPADARARAGLESSLERLRPCPL